MKNEHTQTPWCCESSIGIIRQASTGKAICAMPHALKKNAIRKLRAGEEAEISADQKHIVKCVNSHDELLAALKRAEYLLMVTVRYMDENPVAEYLINYDGAECDGGALKDDCESAAQEARLSIAKAEAQ